MTPHRNALAILLVAALAATSITPTFAKPNNGAFHKSIEAAKIDQGLCNQIQGWLRNAEKEADKRSGTKAAEKWSKLADTFWDDGVALGCSWAA